ARVALFTEMRVAGRSLYVYNLHLESRGDDRRRMSQLEEVLADTQQFRAEDRILIAGDLNFNASEGEGAGIIERAGFFDVLGTSAWTTSRRGLFTSGRAIDRALVRGSVKARDGRVHNAVRASDHYPFSFALELG